MKNRAGHVRGLDRDEFELKVDGRPVRFVDFEARGEVPWSIVFLQDLSGSMALSGKLEKSKKAILSFLDQARPGDEFALASFAGGVTAIDVPFTENQRPLRETLERWEAYGKTGLHDAVSLLPQITGDSRNVKRAVILITDGADNASQVTPNQARDIVRRASLPVYVLGLESGDPYAVSAEGEKLDINDEEVTRTYDLFVDVWKDGKLNVVPVDTNYPWECTAEQNYVTGTYIPEEMRLHDDGLVASAAEMRE